MPEYHGETPEMQGSGGRDAHMLTVFQHEQQSFNMSSSHFGHSYLAQWHFLLNYIDYTILKKDIISTMWPEFTAVIYQQVYADEHFDLVALWRLH